KSYKSDLKESNKLSSTITEEPQSNILAQKLVLENQKTANKKLAELNDLYHII
ncbi:21851_t:CDS:1, partial [Gigaspora margarita]